MANRYEDRFDIALRSEDMSDHFTPVRERGEGASVQFRLRIIAAKSGLPASDRGEIVQHA